MTTPDPGLVSVTTAPTGQHAAPPSTAPEPAPAPAAPAASESPLESLRARRKKMQALLYKDLQVPRWGDDGGPTFWVRFAPASPSEHATRFEKIQKNPKKPKDWAVTANAQVLVSACIGVFAVEGDQLYEQDDETIRRLSLRDGDPNGEWTRFDPDLAESLGLDSDCGAIAVVRSLYLTEGDITTTANRLLQWSGMVMPDQNVDFSAS